MDTKNRFHTRETWFLIRAENMTLLVVLSVLVVLHFPHVNWFRFIFAFAIIDLVGYIPGAIAYRRSHKQKIAPIYHHLYNITHSYLTGGVAVGLWALATGGFEWAMLAIPIHYSGDRGIFGNTYKPVSLPFEPMEPVSAVTHLPELQEESK